MKKLAYFAAVAAMLVGFSSCNDEFLDLSPKGSITDATAFTSYESCSAYLLTLYEMFSGEYGYIFPGLDFHLPDIRMDTRAIRRKRAYHKILLRIVGDSEGVEDRAPLAVDASEIPDGQVKIKLMRRIFPRPTGRNSNHHQDSRQTFRKQ